VTEHTCPECGCECAAATEEIDRLVRQRTQWLRTAEAAQGGALLSAQSDLSELRAAAREVWASIPASYDYDDPMVQRHAKALNALGALVEEYAPFAAQDRSHD
jgi:hypothetical protein